MEEDIYLDKLVRRDIKPTAIRLLVIKEMMQAERAVSLLDLETLLDTVDKSTISRCRDTDRSAVESSRSYQSRKADTKNHLAECITGIWSEIACVDFGSRWNRYSLGSCFRRCRRCVACHNERRQNTENDKVGERWKKIFIWISWSEEILSQLQ